MLNLSIYAQNTNPAISQLENNRPKTVTDLEVYIWGGIFFCLSIGSLLLIVHLFPKNEYYKKLLDARRKAAKSGGTPSVDQKPAEVKPKKEEKLPEVKAEETTMVTRITTPTEIGETVPPSTVKDTTPPTQPTIKTELLHTEPSKPTISTPIAKDGESKIVSNDNLFKSKNSETETICKEFLNKLQTYIQCKSISIYFVKNGQFTRYIEKKQDIFSMYDPITERADISEDVIKFLKKKLGAFSSTHADVVLPLVNNDDLFGAVKLQFAQPQKGLNINPIWAEVKSFAKFFQQTNKTVPTIEKESSLYTIEHFNNILNYRVTLDISQNLTLMKVLNTPDKAKVLPLIAEVLKNILGKKPEVYKVSEDTVGIFLTVESREKLGKSLAEVLAQLRKHTKTLDLCVGSSDYHTSFKFPQKWYDKALQALNEAVSAGPNNYKLLIEK